MSKIKEKIEKAKTKYMELRNKAIRKACDFTIDHPKAALGIIIGTVVGGSALGGAAVSSGMRAIKNHKLETSEEEEENTE